MAHCFFFRTQIDVREVERKRQEEIENLQETNKKIAFQLEKTKNQRRLQLENQSQLKQQLDNFV